MHRAFGLTRKYEFVVLFVWDYDKLSMKTACRQKFLSARCFRAQRCLLGQKKLIVIPTTNLLLTLKSNTMKNSMQNYKFFFKQCCITLKNVVALTNINIKLLEGLEKS